MKGGKEHFRLSRVLIILWVTILGPGISIGTINQFHDPGEPWGWLGMLGMIIYFGGVLLLVKWNDSGY
jgi:hypothetical protein